ncbi:putative Oxygen-independent coproporphyrinogen III oxidase [Candidatus Nitrospira nitrosa]|uniref:Heme chaperone HemW n=1 Tax=Candidatus Nitrospira nitrosa TaxID=1742972 RepID=A0A0S4LHX2_9BACT|nr:radical SAM family heme chaperone HemW [Candidatus Nitrospira nitrosa]CUS37180.1 putative Oxygen-independent coproporphyrinogen III oxidase [Candidatus Nitrospira nitrosa]
MTPTGDIGLYVHIPFCQHRCHFCAFYLEIAHVDRIARFYSALTHEIRLQGHHNPLHGRWLQSIYFGGGTPTALPADQLVALLKLIRTTWPTSPTVEVTVEAHPSSVTREGLTILAEAGFTRISFGAESMREQDFVPIGRHGQVRDTATAVQAAREAGFVNVNLDLIYGLPGQSLQDWQRTLELILSLDPSHISCYALTIEEGTKLAQDIARQRVPPIDEQLQLDMEASTEQVLAQAGFVRYEISNYAKPARRCRHNLLYWTGGEYLGLGPSAQSYLDEARFGNVADLDRYLTSLSEHRLPLTDYTKLSRSERERDALVFGLRLLRGVPLQAVTEADRDSEIEHLITGGFLSTDQEHLWLTPLGRRYADSVAERLF